MAEQRIPVEIWSNSPVMPSYVNALVLAANTAESLTIPTWADFILMSPNNALAEVYVRVGATATVPAADTTDGTSSFRGQTFMRVDARTGISVISPNAGILTYALYKAP